MIIEEKQKNAVTLCNEASGPIRYPTTWSDYFCEKMRQKKVTCEYCAEELEVRASSKGPFYCGNDVCEQMRKPKSMLGETLSIDRNYVDTEDDPMGELSITTASEEDELHARKRCCDRGTKKKSGGTESSG